MNEPTVGKRFYPRFPYGIPIAIRKISSTPIVEAELVDLSIGGCMFRSGAAIRLNLADFIEVKLRSTCLALRLMAWVRHLDQRNGIYGVEFHRLGDRESKFLHQVVDELIPPLVNKKPPTPHFEPVHSTNRLPELVMSGPRRNEGY